MSTLYVAPERWANNALPNSQQADVYSMGVSLGEFLLHSKGLMRTEQDNCDL